MYLPPIDPSAAGRGSASVPGPCRRHVSAHGHAGSASPHKSERVLRGRAALLHQWGEPGHRSDHTASARDSSRAGTCLRLLQSQSAQSAVLCGRKRRGAILRPGKRDPARSIGPAFVGWGSADGPPSRGAARQGAGQPLREPECRTPPYLGIGVLPDGSEPSETV